MQLKSSRVPPVHRRLFFKAVWSTAFIGLAGCEGSQISWRYRLTLVVDDNGVRHAGSSVVEVEEHWTNSLDSSGVRPFSRGEATAVDLGAGRLLLGLLTGGDRWVRGDLPKRPPNTVWRDYPGGVLTDGYHVPSRWEHGEPPEMASLVGRPPLHLSPEQLPNLVTFKDKNDPSTLVWVDPRDLASVFGNGVSLADATLEVTRDPITRRLKSQLPWVSFMRQYIDGRDSPTSVHYYMTDFTSG